MDTGSFDKLVNRIIDKKYKIESAVGVGGMAYVLKAKDLASGKDVAVKVLSDEFKEDERAVKRFINESKTVSMLHHENIVSIHDVVINPERKYIVMEFIDGITLKDYIDKIGVLSWKEAIHYIKQVLSALSHAHEKQVIHRDVKPQNIMLLPDGTVKVTDFGIAKLPDAESITMTDKAIGTVNYISPEQASGAHVDARTDIYSVGVMLYEMVTGKLPFVADSPVAVAMMQVSNEPLAPREINPQIPVGLEQIILKAMQKKPEDRFVSAAAMLKALNYFAANPDIVFAGSVSDTGAAGAKLTESDYEDAETKEEKLRKKIRGSRSMFPIISGIAASFFVVAIAVVTVAFAGSRSADDIVDKGTNMLDDIFSAGGSAEKIRVDSFVDKVYGDALVAEMEESGFAVETVTYVRDAKKGTNVVVRQYPESDAIRLKPSDGSLIPVTLYVNMSENEIHMPDCTLMHVNTAKALILSEIKSVTGGEAPDMIKVVEEYHDSYPADYVIRTEPTANSAANLENLTEITVFVSKGMKIANTKVPDLEDVKLDDAKRKILESKLALGRIYYEENAVVPAGYVIKASRAGGEIAASGITSIDLWVSIGTTEIVPEIPNGGQQADEKSDNYGKNETPSVSEPQEKKNDDVSEGGETENSGSSAEESVTEEIGEPTVPTEPQPTADDNEDEPTRENTADDIANLFDMRENQ